MSLHKIGTTATFLTLLLLAGAATASTASKTSSKSTSKSTASTHATSHHSSSTHKTSAKNSKHSSKTTAVAHSHGQRTIGEDRTREIQSALIREHYLTGDPSGAWDSDSKDAMMRFQAANGWQTKVTPDSRALIKLGLGPDNKNLLNPDTAVIASPHQLGLTKDALPGGSTAQ